MDDGALGDDIPLVEDWLPSELWEEIKELTDERLGEPPDDSDDREETDDGDERDEDDGDEEDGELEEGGLLDDEDDVQMSK